MWLPENVYTLVCHAWLDIKLQVGWYRKLEVTVPNGRHFLLQQLLCGVGVTYLL